MRIDHGTPVWSVPRVCGFVSFGSKETSTEQRGAVLRKKKERNGLNTGVCFFAGGGSRALTTQRGKQGEVLSLFRFVCSS